MNMILLNSCGLRLVDEGEVLIWFVRRDDVKMRNLRDTFSFGQTRLHTDEGDETNRAI